MTRKNRARRISMATAHQEIQRANAAADLADAQATAKAQKKGDKAVQSIMERAGYVRKEKVVPVKVIGKNLTRTVKLVSYKRFPKSALPRIPS